MKRWRAHPALAWLIRVIAIAVPVAAAVAVAVVVTKLLPEPETLAGLTLWWLAVVGTSITALWLLRTLGRRLLPLSVLLRLSLVFPDRAPSRFKIALRTWSIAHLAADVRNARSHGMTEDTTAAAELLLGLLASLGQHDPLTRGHSARTRAYTDVLAEELGLGDDDRERLRWAALLHDVGKLEVPTAILRKDGEPDPDEWQALHRHPEIGYELTRPLHAFLGEWAKTILHHHERWNGTGYPFKLRGEEISYGARIVGVADAFDAMTSARSYQPARPPQVVRKELAYRAGTQFDPQVVRALLNVSIGRIRRIMGPLAVVAQLPLIGGLRRVGQTVGAVAVAGAGMMALAFGGVVDVPTTTTPVEVLGAVVEMPTIIIDIVGADSAVDSTSIEVVSPPENGTATALGDGTISYQPLAGASGADSLEYRVCRGDRCTVERIEVLLDGSGGIVLASAPPGVSVTLLDGSAVAAADGGAATAVESPTTTTALAAQPTRPGPSTTTTTTTTVPTTTAALAAEPTRAGPTTTTTTTTTTTVPTSTTTITTTTTTTTIPATVPTTTTPTTVPTTIPATVPTTTTPTTGPTTTSVPGNTSPIAIDDTAITDEDTVVIVAVLDNDGHVDPVTATLTVKSDPKDGAATIVGATIEYAPDADFNGGDSFRYEVCSSPGSCDTGTATVTVTPVNDPPDARPDTASANVGNPKTVDVLQNDEDVDGDALIIVSFDAESVLGGTIIRDDRGTTDPTDDRLVYTSALDWNEDDDTFTYLAGDGNGGTASVVVTITS